jgi:3-phenylpropionate/cinnamic acid dioxygenase small subunit
VTALNADAAAAAIDRAALEELYATYTDLLDEDRLEEWLELFVPDAVYRAVSRENWARGLPLSTMAGESRAMLADRVTAIRSTSMYVPRTLRHVVGRLRVRPADTGDGVVVTASWVVAQTLVGEPTTLFAAGSYYDRVVAGPVGRLLFAEKVAVYDSDVVPTSLIYPL